MLEIINQDTQTTWQNFSANPVAFYRRVADEMADRGVTDSPTLSHVLEFATPTQQGQLDAFSRMMRAAGIITRSDPTAGIWASEASRFFEEGPAHRALYTEFFARNWRAITFATPQQRAVLLSSDATPGSFRRPYFEGMAALEQQIAAAIPLSELIFTTTPIAGDSYRSLFLEYDATQLRKFRIGESAEIPIATIVARDHVNTIHKYGRGLRASYEVLRRMRVDMLAWFIKLAAIQSEMDKVAAGLSVLINGDGNTDTAATTHDLTTLDGDADVGKLTLKGWLSFKMKFTQPYFITTALMQEAVALQLALLNVGSANVPLMGANLGGMVQSLTPINTTSDGLRYGWTSDAPALKIVGFDRRFAMHQVVEIGADIVEMERFITTQDHVLTMTEVQGFAIADPAACLILDVNA